MSERSLQFCFYRPKSDEPRAMGPPHPAIPRVKQELQILPMAQRGGCLEAPMRETAIEMLTIINVCNSCQKAPAQPGRAGEGERGARRPPGSCSRSSARSRNGTAVAVAHCISFSS